MISIETATGLMFGNLQCTNMRAVMDALPETEVVRLLTEWRRYITENRESAVERILRSVAAHPALAGTWNEKGGHDQQAHVKIFQIIVDDTKPAEHVGVMPER